jgi:5-methylcytosine-specific restriction endonuclease McrA
MDTKICKKCGESKPLVKFQPNKGCVGGRQYICRQCSISPEAIARSERNKYAKHSEKIKQRVRQWNSENEEYRKEQKASYYQNNKEYFKKRNQEYYAAHPEFFNLYAVRRRARKVAAGGSFTVAQWRELCARYGNACLCCKRKRKLTKDHIIPLSKGGSNDISNIQPLCLPCNLSKGVKTIDYRVDC